MDYRVLKSELDNVKNFKEQILEGITMCFETASELVTETRNVVSESDLSELQDTMLTLLQAESEFDAFKTKMSGLKALIDESEDGSVDSSEFDIGKNINIDILKQDKRYIRLLEIVASISDKRTKESVIDDDLSCTTEACIPLDPITQKLVEVPVKNVHCGHTYDKESISNYLKLKKSVLCPAIACKNLIPIKMKELVVDVEIQNLILRKK